MAETITVNQPLVSGLLPCRDRRAHKGKFGKVHIFGGSVGYTGAPVLAALGALRCGAGLVFLSVPEKIYPIVAVKCLEAMPSPLPENETGAEAARQALTGKDAALIGPGLGRSKWAEELALALLNSAACPVVLDADGLNAVSAHIDKVDGRDKPTILTPHEGEFARLGGDLSLGREAAARAFAQQHRCILVLKGRGTLTALPDGTMFVNTTGNPGMATGGSGDVLAGMVLALLGQGLTPPDAAVAAVWLHGRAGDLAAADKGEYGMLPSDLAEQVPYAIKEIVGR